MLCVEVRRVMVRKEHADQNAMEGRDGGQAPSRGIRDPAEPAHGLGAGGAGQLRGRARTGALATPEEQAWPLLALSSDLCSIVTGAVLTVDQGMGASGVGQAVARAAARGGD
jgi:NAD(P)-dependent dehydrogenase (short-subunit alcohol dehydrogenase family)